MQATSMQKLQYQVFQAGPIVYLCNGLCLSRAWDSAITGLCVGNIWKHVWSKHIFSVATEHRFYSQSFEDSAISSV